MNTITRRTLILERLDSEGECHVMRMADDLGVSPMTIRRDLDALEKEGRVLRTHGGAAPAGRVAFAFQFLQRENEQSAAKLAIGILAASLVQDGQSVLLDSGTTTLAVARELKARRKLTVITTSLPIASELQHSDAAELILLGGNLRRETPDLIGALTEMNLEQLRADVAFIGAEAVDAGGTVFSSSLAVARLLKKMAASARQVHIVADSTKIGRSALARFGVLKNWSGLITDNGIAAAVAQKLGRAGVRVIRAK